MLRFLVCAVLVSLLAPVPACSPAPKPATVSGAQPSALAATLPPPGAIATGAQPSALASALPPAAAPDDNALQVAVTFDDLPFHGPLRPDETIVEVHQSIVDSLAKHRIEGVYGFVNGQWLESEQQGRRVLEQWRDAGHVLANHTWSHADLDAVGPVAFVAEIDRNDALLAALVGDSEEARRARRVFRYPYLRQGRDAAVLDAVRAHLQSGGYRLGEVTIDFSDWAYNAPYVRCAASGAEASVAALRAEFISRALQALQWSDAAAQAIYGRRIPHVLLLHSGSFDAQMLDELLSAYETANVHWIGLAEALTDTAYQEDVRVPSPHGRSLLSQRIERDAIEHPPYPVQPLALLGQLCVGGEK